MTKKRITLTLASYGIVPVAEVDTPMECILKFNVVSEEVYATLHPIFMGLGADFSSEDYLLYQFGNKENPSGDPEGTIAMCLEKISHLVPEA